MKKMFCLLGLLVPGISFAQQYSIDWHKVSGGGGSSTNGQYSLSGTIGQPDAGGPMTNGNYSVTGGFWSLYAVQTAGAPTLTVTIAANQVVVSWPTSATGWTLQTNSSLGNANWSNYSGSVVNNRVTNSTPMGNLFFPLEAVKELKAKSNQSNFSARVRPCGRIDESTDPVCRHAMC